MNYDTISRADVIKIIKSVLSPASSLVNVARARRQMLNEINELESKSEPHWISVTERLPDKENKSYWICTNTGYQCQCRWTDNIYGLGSIGDRWGWKKVDIPQYTYVTAWMPLPESYKEVTE